MKPSFEHCLQCILLAVDSWSSCSYYHVSSINPRTFSHTYWCWKCTISLSLASSSREKHPVHDFIIRKSAAPFMGTEERICTWSIKRWEAMFCFSFAQWWTTFLSQTQQCFAIEREGIENGDKVPCICQFENHARVVITSVHLSRGLSQNLRCAYASRFRDTSFK